MADKKMIFNIKNPWRIECMKENNLKDLIVEWDGGIVRGFRTMKEAERYIARVCKKTAPGLNYSIYSTIQCIKTKNHQNNKFY